MIGDIPFARILHVYFLHLQPSTETRAPQKVCATCESQLESTLMLRRRAQFTQSVWSRYQQAWPDNSTTTDYAKIDEDIVFNCHLCQYGSNFKNLQSHISFSHGEDHAPSCDFCRTVLQTPPRESRYEIFECVPYVS